MTHDIDDMTHANIDCHERRERQEGKKEKEEEGTNTLSGGQVFSPRFRATLPAVLYYGCPNTWTTLPVTCTCDLGFPDPLADFGEPHAQYVAREVTRSAHGLESPDQNPPTHAAETKEVLGVV